MRRAWILQIQLRRTGAACAEPFREGVNMNVLSFASFDIRFTANLPGEIILMALGGRRPCPLWLAGLDFYQSVWAVDSGADVCLAAGIVPERIIGDGDSAGAGTWRRAEELGSEVYSYESEKDLTDFQLALELLSREETSQTKGLFLTGAFGGRFDHLISVLYSFTGWSGKYIPIGMADEKEALFLLPGGGAEIVFRDNPTAVSLLPLEDSEGVSICGVRWPLENVRLERARPYSVSNRPDARGRVAASVGKGLVGLYCAWGDII